MKKFKCNHVLGLLLLAGVLTGCGSDNDTASNTYEVTVSNLTHNQPLSPVGVLLHSESTDLWEVGSPASVELEDLAEGGSNAALLTLDDGYKEASVSGNGLIMPGNNETITLSTSDNGSNLYLSIASMLINTNDGFIGVTGLEISNLTPGDSMNMTLSVFDAGTEVNSELVNTIPGQMGEGFNAERIDSNLVSHHSGVVGMDDGHSDSVLDSSHKFDNPAVLLTITRLD